MGRLVWVVGLLGLAAPGCTTRSAPYHFRGDLVGGVRAEPIGAARRRSGRPAALQPALASERAQTRTLDEAPTKRRPLAPTAAATRPAEGGDLDRDPDVSAEAPPTLATGLRSLVGERDKKSSHVEFALRALASLGIEADDELASAGTGNELVRIADARSALDGPNTALLGDLVVFDGVVAGAPASLVGVVVSSRPGGTIEFVYLGRGVVRRGYVNAQHPGDKRDASGRAQNTFVRHSDGDNPRGTRYLAGRLVASVIRLDRLLR